jgi:hypothetical protein
MSNVIINQSLSPTSLIRGLSETVPKDSRRKKKAVCDKEFYIPTFEEYESLVTNNYRVKHLKMMCRHYKQKISGNKDQLVSRMYNFLRLSFVVAVIQRFWRRRIGKDYDLIHGPARHNRGICLNETDFFSMEPLSEVPYSQFFSYRDTDDMVYGFDILSLFNLLSKGDNNTSNPYNRKPIPRGVRKNLNRLIRLSRLVGEEVTVEIEESEVLCPIKRLELRTLSLFQEIDELGNYTDPAWFHSLGRVQVIRYIRELADIWEYRAQLTDHVKREICPPIGNPFRGINLNALPNMTIEALKKLSLNLMDGLVKRGVNVSSRSLGANYVLCALTLVNPAAATCLPWLYQSVAPHG